MKLRIAIWAMSLGSFLMAFGAEKWSPNLDLRLRVGDTNALWICRAINTSSTPVYVPNSNPFGHESYILWYYLHNPERNEDTGGGEYFVIGGRQKPTTNTLAITPGGMKQWAVPREMLVDESDRRLVGCYAEYTWWVEQPWIAGSTQPHSRVQSMPLCVGIPNADGKLKAPIVDWRFFLVKPVVAFVMREQNPELAFFLLNGSNTDVVVASPLSATSQLIASVATLNLPPAWDTEFAGARFGAQGRVDGRRRVQSR